MACLAEVFEQENALDKLEAFASLNGPAFYGLPANEATITLTRQDEAVVFPRKVAVGQEEVTVFDPMIPIHWNVGS